MAGMFWDPICLAAKTVYNVNEQSSVTLICTSNSLRGKVKWTHGERTYSQDDANSNYQINWKDSEISLTIKCVDHSDAGEYVCEVDGTFLSGSAKCPAITLNVWNGPRYPNENQRAQSDESITLNCEIQRPNTDIIGTIYWTHNSQEINTHNERYNVKLLPSPSLKIHKVSDDDAGIYELRVKGSAYPSHSKSRQCIRLEVQPKVVALENKYVAHVHTNITLHCETFGADTCTWKHNGDEISTGNRFKINDDMSLTISPVRQSDEGGYVCEVKSRAGITAASEEIELNVWNGPRYSNENQRAQSNESITLRCEIQHPNIDIIGTIYWTHNSQEINTHDERYDVKLLLPSPSLKIHKVSDDDAGIYELRVKGSAYSSHSKPRQCIRLEVQPKVVALENKYVAYVHTNITLHCETFGADTCTWKRNGDEISTGNRFKINDDMSLTISPVRQSDKGGYVCEVKSRAGIPAASEEIELDTLHSKYSKLPPKYSQSTEMKEIEMKKIDDLMSKIPDDKSAWFYFIGRCGAGKSSTISSFHSVEDCRISTVALPGGGERSFTNEVSCTEIFGRKVKLYDTPGYDGTGKFDVKHFFSFIASFDDKAKAHSKGDQPMSVVVYVIDCSNEPTEEELKNMQQVHEHVKLKDNLQMVALLTKIDQASQNAKEIPEMLLSQKLCKVVEQINRMVQLPVNCIFAICNYYKEMDNDPTKDWLILYTFRSLLERLLDVNERLKREKIVT